MYIKCNQSKENYSESY